eukprot:2653445-Pyramimonas_sp.AAC.1
MDERTCISPLIKRSLFLSWRWHGTWSSEAWRRSWLADTASSASASSATWGGKALCSNAPASWSGDLLDGELGTGQK